MSTLRKEAHTDEKGRLMSDFYRLKYASGSRDGNKETQGVRVILL